MNGKCEEATICLVDYYKAAKFFLRIASSDRSRQYVFVTHLPSVWVECVQRGVRCKLITRYFSKAIAFGSVRLSETREVVSGIQDERDAVSMVRAYLFNVERLSGRYPLRNVLVWNGQTLVGEVARLLNKMYGLKTLFFEIANIPGKIFVDPCGVNCESKLYSDLRTGVLCAGEWDRKEYDAWRAQYIESKRRNNLVPQAVGKHHLKWFHILDFIYAKLFGYKNYSRRSFRDKNPFATWVRCKSNKDVDISFSSHEDFDDGRGFVFYPGQVHDDTQLLMNSDIGNVEAIRKILKLTCKRIFVKPHPAGGVEEYKSLLDVVQEGRVVFTNANTFELIQKSDEVYTINSTVGLEARILGKDVTFFGKSVYREMSNENLGWYIMRHLIDVDFFSERQQVDDALVESIYFRAV